MEDINVSESFLRKIRKSDYDEAEREKQIMNETAAMIAETVRQEVQHVPPIVIAKQNKFNKFKAVLTECFCNLYEKSLIIDDVKPYAKALRESAAAELSDLMKDCNSTKDVFVLFENASSFVQEAMILAESIADGAVDPTEPAIKQADLVSDDDKKLIADFEKVQGTDDIAKEVQDRVVDVFKAEEEAAQERKEQAQNIIESLASKNGELNESVIASGLNTFSEVPTSVFHAIYMNRSKLALNEAAGTGSANKAQDTDKQLLAAIMKDVKTFIGKYPYKSAIKVKDVHEFEDADSAYPNDNAWILSVDTVKLSTAKTDEAYNDSDYYKHHNQGVAELNKNLVEPLRKILEKYNVKVVTDNDKHEFMIIIVKKGKKTLHESSSFDLVGAQEQILGETVCMYTLLECIHGLGLKTIDYDEREKLKVKLHIGKM